MEFAIAYVVVGAIVGTRIAMAETVHGNWWTGKPLKYPRLVMGIAAGIIWPYALWKILNLPK